MIIFLTGISPIYCQEIDSLSLFRQKEIILTPNVDTIIIDQFSLIPNSLHYLNPKEGQNFQIDYINALVYELNNSETQDTISISYRVFPFKMNGIDTKINKFDTRYRDSIMKLLVIDRSTQSDIFEFDQLKVEGGLGRSLNFGNNQNLVVNSNLNLRLSGKVADGVNVVGVLTDSNIPFQPQGNTQQIRELDQVFLQFSKNTHTVTLGDFEYRKPKSYFLNFDKRLQGINYSGTFNTKNDWEITTSNSGAVSKGKYAQNNFVGQEGNQGPYKLFGANNESFIIILAGTEQVFIDGVLLQRGLDRDYTIDYNTGEITFTSTNLITNRSRVAIEFEYTDQTYNSSLLFSETAFKKDKLSFRLNIYAQQDSKNRARLTDTTLTTSGIFSNIGDNQEDFFINSYRNENYNAERIQYRAAIDSLVNGVIHDTIFVYSRNPTDDLYNVIYTFVGEGNGDYKVVNGLVTNGRVYEWISPINNQMQGDYIAKISLRPPTKNQLASITTAYQFSDKHALTLETSVSNRDLNTLSTIGDEDNNGFAGRLNWQNGFYLGKDSLKHKVLTTLNYELKGNQFRPIERYRPIEFTRDWNVNNNASDSLSEGYGNLQVQYLLDQNKRFSYSLSNFTQQNLYKGNKQTAALQIEEKGFKINGKVDYLSAAQENVKSSFFRPHLQIEKKVSGITIGTKAQQNIREFEDTQTTFLTNSSIGDEDYSFYISTSDTSRVPLSIKYNKHFDSTPFEQELVGLFEANEYSIEGRIQKSKNHSANWTFTYRDLIVKDTTLTNESGKNSLLGKFNYAGNFINGVLRTGFDYELGSGREPKREFSYIEVANGEGLYIWIDYNNNGIQEITEFEISPFTDQANFVRVFTNSNEYINADTGRLNQWIQLEPANVWRNEKGLKNAIGRLSLNANLSLGSKLFENAPGARFNPYTFNLDRDGLISSNNRLGGRLIYNKLSNKFRFSYLFQQNDTKNQLISGFEQRENLEHKFTSDIYFKNKITLQIEAGTGNNQFFSENYNEKTFNYDRYFGKPKLTWILNNELRIAGEYEYSKSENLIEFGGQQATNNSIEFDLNWNKREAFAVISRFQYDNVVYTGETNDAVSFSMLKGLQNGQNLLWNLSFERNILEFLRVNLTYDGRKLGEFDPVHTARARITAVF